MYSGKTVETHPCHMSVAAESPEAADVIFAYFCVVSLFVFSPLELPSVLFQQLERHDGKMSLTCRHAQAKPSEYVPRPGRQFSATFFGVHLCCENKMVRLLTYQKALPSTLHTCYIAVLWLLPATSREA